MIVTKQDYERVDWTKCVLDLKTGDLSGGGKAVIRSVSRPGNTKAILWLPGLGSSFIHVHG